MNTRSPQNAGKLFFYNTIGNTTVTNPKSGAKTAAKKRKPEPRKERITFIELTENTKPVLAALPEINTQAFAETMDNYRIYIANYNELVTEENEAIARHNAKVRIFKAENKLNEVQTEFSRIFMNRNIGKKPKEYNALVAEFNQDRGMILEKKKFLTVKYASEIVFQQMLYLYSQQLAKYTAEYRKLSIVTESPLRAFEINSHHITNLKRNGEYSINVCNATIRNHRERLEEAGVFVDYQFRGHKKGLKMNISSHILTVFDQKTKLLTQTDNQSFTSQRRKELIDNNEVTRTFNTNIKKRENGQADFLDKGTASPDFSFVFYGNIPEQDAKSKLGGARENVKVSKTLSEKLEESIMHPQDLAIKLTAGEFHNHNRLDKRTLYHEATNGTMNREDFKALIIQEFFKNAARLYRTSTPFVGSWKKAINSYMDKMFVVSNGPGNTWLNSKEMMVDKLQELLWRINSAHKWFLKAGFNPSYPSDYFDFTRKEKKEIGFEYTLKKWLDNQKYIENKPKLAQAVKKKAEIRAKSINHSKKFEQKMNSFIKNRIELPELIEYVDCNLPPVYLQKLSDYLLKIQTQYTC